MFYNGETEARGPGPCPKAGGWQGFAGNMFLRFLPRALSKVVAVSERVKCHREISS